MNMDTKNLPLVSIPVVTYNSSQTVLETLDSIYNQTYPNIELIVSDDCSTDNTVDICREWIASHKERFVRTELLTVEKNTGVTSNCNRAEDACHSEWVKTIAGDDLLLPHSIQRYVEFIIKNPQTIYLFGKVEVFGDNDEIVKGFEEWIFDYSFFDLSLDKQYEWLIARGTQPIPASTSFYNKKAVHDLGIIYDERIPMLEDWPRWIQCIEKGVRFEFIDEVVVKYRVSENSICSGIQHRKRFLQSGAWMYILYQYPKNIEYVGRRKAIQRFIESNAMVRKNPLWKIAKGIIALAYQPYTLYKNMKSNHK